jgi:hypothetical protein
MSGQPAPGWRPKTAVCAACKTARPFEQFPVIWTGERYQSRKVCGSCFRNALSQYNEATLLKRPLAEQRLQAMQGTMTVEQVSEWKRPRPKPKTAATDEPLPLAMVSTNGRTEDGD